MKKCNDKEYKEFSRDDMFLDNNSKKLTNFDRIVSLKNAVWPDRSNFIIDLSFLNTAWDPMIVPNPILIHIGSANSTYIPYLYSLYPEFEYHLYDIRDFVTDYSIHSKINAHQNYFDELEALRWSNRDDVYLINHAHTIKYNEREDDVIKRDKKILDDLKVQEKWIKTVGPIKGSLRFRSPDIYNEVGQHMKYLHGYNMLLPWIGPLKYETRLLVDQKELNDITWDLKKYKRQMMWHDIIVRQNYKYFNPTVDFCDKSEIDPPELINDYDSTLEASIWIDYLKKRRGVSVISQKEVAGLSRNLTKILNENSDKNTSLSILRNDE